MNTDNDQQNNAEAIETLERSSRSSRAKKIEDDAFVYIQEESAAIDDDDRKLSKRNNRKLLDDNEAILTGDKKKQKHDKKSEPVSLDRKSSLSKKGDRSVNNVPQIGPLCTTCEKPVKETLACGRCNSAFCMDCAGMKPAVFKTMRSQPGAVWCCLDCREPALKAMKQDCDIEKQCKEFLDKMSARVDTLEVTVDAKADISTVEKLEANVKNLEKKMQGIVTEMETLKKPNGNPRRADEISSDIDQSASEVRERDWRRKNIIMFNVQEHNDDDDAKINREKDLETVTKLCKDELDIQVVPTLATRLGGKTETKTDHSASK
ncbi:MAG: hypothetical protein DRI57_25630 [Deltaproteobacteria bacterium]|nr:MAG: hypothetical protein DRI57_25630 [Deltaproteobacteria bacterium]